MAVAVQSIIESDITETLGYIRNGNSLILIRPTFYNAEEFIAKLASSVQCKTLIVHTNSRSKDRINFRLTRPSGIEMITYKALSLGNAGDISTHGYGLIIFADAHSMLANNTNIAIERILKLNKAVLVGITSTSIFETNMLDIRDKYLPKYREYYKNYKIGRVDEEAGKLLRTMRKYEIGNVNRTKILAELASLLIALKAQLIIELFSYRYDATALILANPSLEGTYLELISANKTDELVAYRIQELEDRVDHIAARLEEAKTENILDSKYLEYKMLPMIDKLHDRRNCMLNFQREYFRLIKRKRALQSLLKHIMVLRKDIMKALVIQ